MTRFIIEIRPGEGGEDSRLFTQDLANMYKRYLEAAGTVPKISQENTLLKLECNGEFPSLWKYEPGIHRVQRVPPTEKKGRRQSSTVTVAIIFPKKQSFSLREKDIKMRFFRGSGPGGQHKNKTETGVELIHMPTGIKATCSYGRSQKENKRQAMMELSQRVTSFQKSSNQKKQEAYRRQQIGTSGREEKIRTYNFIENRVKDERIKKPLYCLDKVLNGDLDRILSKLKS